MGSAVYIGNNVLLTAAHCLCNSNEISSINKKLHHFAFYQINAKGKTVKTYHAKKINFHPLVVGPFLIGQCGSYQSNYYYYRYEKHYRTDRWQ